MTREWPSSSASITNPDSSCARSSPLLPCRPRARRPAVTLTPARTQTQTASRYARCLYASIVPSRRRESTAPRLRRDHRADSRPCRYVMCECPDPTASGIHFHILRIGRSIPYARVRFGKFARDAKRFTPAPSQWEGASVGVGAARSDTLWVGIVWIPPRNPPLLGSDHIGSVWSESR